MNKNISVWRGDNTPPTQYHLWLKNDGRLYVNIEEQWQEIDKQAITQITETLNQHATKLDNHQTALNDINNLNSKLWTAGKGDYSVMTCGTKRSLPYSHSEGATGRVSVAEGYATTASGNYSHVEGFIAIASGDYSHAEGYGTIASGYCAHAQGKFNIENDQAIHSIGVGEWDCRKNSEFVYSKYNDSRSGYKYLIGIGGYDGISTDITTYKSIQEVIADIDSTLKVKADLVDGKVPLEQLGNLDMVLFEVVKELPTTNIKKHIYLIKVSELESGAKNLYAEYIYTGDITAVYDASKWEKLGVKQIETDLSDYYTKEETDSQIQAVKNSAINIHNKDTAKSIKLSIDNRETETEYGSTVNASLTDGVCSIDINPMGIFNKQGNFISQFAGYGLAFTHDEVGSAVTYNQVVMYKNNNPAISIEIDSYDKNLLTIGNDKKFEISRPVDNTKGATITGVESITAFANPSATKVWATDGSTINMPTKFSDLKNDSIYITGNKGETDAKFKIYYNQDNIVRSKLIYAPRHAGVGIPELALVSYDTSGHNLSQLRIRPDDNRDNGQYLIQVQNVIGDTINYVSTLATENVSLQNFKNNTSVDLKSDELIFYGDPQGEQIQLKINKEGIIKTKGKSTEIFAADGSTVDLSTYTNYFNGTTTADKLKAKAVEVTDNTNSVAVSPTGITATNGSATKVFATDGSIADLSTKANVSDVLLKKSADEGYYIEECNYDVGRYAFSTNYSTKAYGFCSLAEGFFTETKRTGSHAEGSHTVAPGNFSHAQGCYNVGNRKAIHSVGIGTSKTRKTAEYIYAEGNEFSYGVNDDPKNGYKYLIGVGGYDGISIDDTTYKSVQEVIADLTARIEQLEKLQNQKTL